VSSNAPSIARAAALRGGRVRFRGALRAAAPWFAAALALAIAVSTPSAPWPLVAVGLGALVGALCGTAPRRNEPALTLGFGLVGLEVRFDELVSAGSVVLVAPLVFWVLLALGQWLSRALALVDGRSAGLVALGLSGSGLPPLLVAAQRDRAVSPAHTSTALVVVVASGVLASLVLPPLGALLHLRHTDLGLWLGVVVSQTTQARASAALVSPEAVAMVASTKLVLLAVQGLPLVAYLGAMRAVLTNASGERQPAHAVGLAVVRALLPRHALAFAAAALVAAFVEPTGAVLDTSGTVVTACFVHLLVTAGRDLGAGGRAGFPWRAVVSGIVVWFLAAAGLGAALSVAGGAVSQGANVRVDLDRSVGVLELRASATRSPLDDAPASCETRSMAPADDAADGLRRAWERRARSPLREFLVASAADFEDDAAADAQARLDLVGLFLGHAPQSIAGWRVLEIGCGSARLARFIAPRVASYTGIDIAPTMVALARERCTDPRARFLVGDGCGVPPELAHERFDFVFSWAVMIHVPRAIAISNLASAWRHVAPGGELRFNFRAAASDASPLDDPAAVLGMQTAFEPPPPRVVAVTEDAVRRQSLDRLLAAEPGEPSYMGHAFPRAELTAAVAEHTDGTARIVRPHPDHLYAIVRRNTT
jgi:SAM-dependent methyltransferase/uncharacterized membrane protein YadS